MRISCKSASEVFLLREYKTKQRDLILGLFNSGSYLTADDIFEKLKSSGVNKSTIYRNLEKLTVDSRIIRELSKDGSKAIYKINPAAHCNGHLHLKCAVCGKVMHLTDEDSTKLEKIIGNNYAFSLDDKATVITGICDVCSKN